jgi:polar amino acid transport system substrate-binding protein
MELKQFFSILIAAIFSVITLSTPSTLSAQSTLPLRLATQSLPPYQMIKGDQMVGIAIDRVRCVLDGMSIPYEFHMTSWSEAQLGTETGKFDGFFVGSSNSSRARYSVPTDPIVTENLAWYLPLGSVIDPNDKADTLRARYSAKFATSKWRYLHLNGYNVVMRPRDADSLLNMLLVGDVDVALEYELIFSYFMAERGLSEKQFQKIPFRRQTMGLHLAQQFVDANPLFMDRFNTRLTQCLVSTQ